MTNTRCGFPMSKEIWCTKKKGHYGDCAATVWVICKHGNNACIQCQEESDMSDRALTVAEITQDKINLLSALKHIIACASLRGQTYDPAMIQALAEAENVIWGFAHRGVKE